MKTFYELGYRFFRMPWEMGPRQELVDLVQSARISPGRAIDLGCGTGSNAIFLAQHGFQVVGIDYAASAIEKARRKAREANVDVRFLIDDLTGLRNGLGTFDFLLDYGTLDDLQPKDRDLYVENLLRLTHPGSQYLLWCFEWPIRWWERLVFEHGPFGAMALEPGEAESRFAPYLEIELIASKTNPGGWPRGYAAYLMTRKSA